MPADFDLNTLPADEKDIWHPVKRWITQDITLVDLVVEQQFLDDINATIAALPADSQLRRCLVYTSQRWQRFLDLANAI